MKLFTQLYRKNETIHCDALHCLLKMKLFTAKRSICEGIKHARQVTELLTLLIQHTKHVTKVLILLVPCLMLLGTSLGLGTIISSSLPPLLPHVALCCNKNNKINQTRNRHFFRIMQNDKISNKIFFKVKLVTAITYATIN